MKGYHKFEGMEPRSPLPEEVAWWAVIAFCLLSFIIILVVSIIFVWRF